MPADRQTPWCWTRTTLLTEPPWPRQEGVTGPAWAVETDDTGGLISFVIQGPSLCWGSREMWHSMGGWPPQPPAALAEQPGALPLLVGAE